VDLGPVLRAHAFLRVERPFTMWPAEVDDVALNRLLGETIAYSLGRGTELADVGLRAANVTVEHDDAPVPAGDYVTIEIAGVGDWSPDVSWTPAASDAVVVLTADVTAALRGAEARWAYTRALPDRGSITVFFPREPTHRRGCVARPS
jgi:hypothetical protein